MFAKSSEIIDNNIVADRFGRTNGVVAIIHLFAVWDYLTAMCGAEENGDVIDSKVLCAADYAVPLIMAKSTAKN